MTDSHTKQQPYIIVGQIGKTFGVQGWLKINSYTDPVENLLDYDPWFIQQGKEWVELPVTEVKLQGNNIIAHIENYDAPETARMLTSIQIAVQRTQLPSLPKGEFFWCDLVGMEVVTTTGEILGHVERLFQTGANDILVVQGKREYLIPFIKGHFILDINADTRQIKADWDPEF